MATCQLGTEMRTTNLELLCLHGALLLQRSFKLCSCSFSASLQSSAAPPLTRLTRVKLAHARRGRSGRAFKIKAPRQTGRKQRVCVCARVRVCPNCLKTQISWLMEPSLALLLGWSKTCSHTALCSRVWTSWSNAFDFRPASWLTTLGSSSVYNTVIAPQSHDASRRKNKKYPGNNMF